MYAVNNSYVEGLVENTITPAGDMVAKLPAPVGAVETIVTATVFIVVVAGAAAAAGGAARDAGRAERAIGTVRATRRGHRRHDCPT